MCRRMRHLKPREIQGCQLALDASIATSLYDATSGGSLVAANGAVARWEDQSGVGRHVTQATAAYQPTRKAATLNGLDAVLFDGSQDNMSRASQTLSDFFVSGTDLSVFMVIRQNGAQANNAALSIGNAVNVFATYSNDVNFDAGNYVTNRVGAAQPYGWDDSLHCFDGVRRSSAQRVYVDNTQLASRSDASGTSGATSMTLVVGDYQASPLIPHKGEIAEVTIIAATISEFMASRMRHSRMRKWRISG